ncbi:MAG: DMT family transporter [Cyanobacteriota bacterium]|nr:DMT family transporter [Cyanobacteriota bacterium]
MGEAVEGWWHRNDVQGARALVLSSLAFSLMTVCVKHLGGRIPVTEIVMARSLVSIMLTGVGLRMAGVNPWGNKRGLLLARGLAGSLALLCFFQAVTSLPLASATVLQYTYPTFTAGAAWILLAEPLRRRIGLAVAVGWIGVVLVIQPQWIGNGMASLALIPVLLGLAGALCTALAYVCVRRLSVTEHPLVIILYFPLVSIPISLPGVIQQGVVPSGLDWLWLLGVGVLTQLGQIWVTRGLSCLPAARATSLNYVQVVFAATWGWIWFHETVNVLTLFGAALVLMASCISISAKR